MRPIERKIAGKISEKGITFDEIWEIVDRTSRQELKKSFPDDSHFQSSKYFAKIIIDSLMRYKVVKKDGNLYKKVEKKKKES